MVKIESRPQTPKVAVKTVVGMLSRWSRVRIAPDGPLFFLNCCDLLFMKKFLGKHGTFRKGKRFGGYDGDHTGLKKWFKKKFRLINRKEERDSI